MTRTRGPGRERFSSNFLFVSLLVLAAAFALLWKLGAGSLAAWDEAIYAEVSKEMARGEGWLTPHWGDRPWFEKPPLFMWVTALFYRLFGVGEFWARVPSALSGIALVAVTYLIGKDVYGQLAGLLSALVLLTCYHFLSFSRFGTMDVMLTLFIYLALYAYVRLKSGNQRWWYLLWSACALAMMVKGAAGIVAPSAIVLALLFEKRLGQAMRSAHFRRGVLLALLIIAPWHVLMYIRHGNAFVDEYIGYHVIARSTRTLEGHPSGYFYYVARLIDGFFPWCLLIPFAVVSSIRRDDEALSGSRALLLLCALVFGLYTLIPTRRPWYIVPLYPALSILIAVLICRLRRKYQSRPVQRRLLMVACVALVIVGGLYSSVSLYFNRRTEEPVATLSARARSKAPEDKDALVLLHGVEPIYAQVPLFYSDRTVRQAYTSSRPDSPDAERYVSYENLAEVMRDGTRRIILRREEIERLSADYDIQVLAEDGPLAYATIEHR